MRILKYIFLLLLLAMVAATVFIATQKGEYDITRSRVINSPRTVVFNYVNDYRNWENWNALKESDPEIKFNYPAVTVGKGAIYSWEGSDGEGNMKTIFVKENDSIKQKMLFNGLTSDVSWKFKDTIGGTKVIWRTKGKLNFMSKIYSATKGGAENLLGEMYDRSLENLDKTLDYEINTYSTSLHGIVQKAGTMYLQQTINSKISLAPKNIQIMLSKMLHFFKKNKIPMNGKPFVIYKTWDPVKGITKFSVCVPIKEEIYTSAGSDITFGKFESFRAVKATLKGDYSHRNEAWDKAFKYVADNKHSQSSAIKVLEIFTKGMEEIKSPSQWVTDIYIPIEIAPAAIRPATTIRPPTPRVTDPEIENTTENSED